MTHSHRGRLEKLIPGYSAHGSPGRSASQPVQDILFDSFSESQEGSAHGTKQVVEGGSRNLFHLLTEAAEALCEKVKISTDSSSRSHEEAAGPFDGQPKASSSSADKALAGTKEGSGKREQAAPKVRIERPQRLTPQPVSRKQLQPEKSHNQPASTSQTAERPTVTDQNALEGTTSHQLAENGRVQSCRTSEDGRGKPGWDSAQEASEASSIAASDLHIPSEMSRQQGSWASASCLSCSPTSLFPLQKGASGSVQTEDEDVPTEAFYETRGMCGRRPPARFSHAAAALPDRLIVFGGAGRGWLGDCFVYHTGRDTWSQIFAGKEGPPPTQAAAACYSHGKVFLFGGKQKQKHCRRLYTLDADSLQWKALKDSANAPPACAAHTMTAVGRHGIYVFGGEGRKLSNAVHALDPVTHIWSRVDTLGAVPPPRQSHSAVWDGSDSLLVFGGSSRGRLFGDVRVLSLSTGFWSEARCRGEAPPPRHSHAAAMPAANLMLVWGGCGERGAVLNDAYLLNTTSFVWHRLKSIGDSPTGRYCHSCHVIDKQILMFGGTNALAHFDSLISVSLDVGQQLGSLADSLQKLGRSSGQKEERAELVRLQLGNHLRQRHANDVSQVAMTRADIAERLFEQERARGAQLAAELRHMSMLFREEEAGARQSAKSHAQALALLQRERDLEGHKCQELEARLQVALATIQRQNGEAVVVDGYKAMYDRLAAERGALVERTVALEYEKKMLDAQNAELEAEAKQLRRRLDATPSLEAADAWEVELDRREASLQNQ